MPFMHIHWVSFVNKRPSQVHRNEVISIILVLLEFLRFFEKLEFDPGAKVDQANLFIADQSGRLSIYIRVVPGSAKGVIKNGFYY